MYRESGNSASKKLHRRDGAATAADRLSSLPDPILVHILSLLPTTKDAVKTSALSKSWQFLWTSVRKLVFSSYLGPNFSLTNFAQSVEKTLILHCAREITKFRISFPFHDSLKFQIDKWLCFAVGRRVEHIDLDFYTIKPQYLLPCFLYRNADLTKLTTSNCIINPPENIHLPSLTHLFLHFTQLSDEVVTKLLSGCPSLESLELRFCSGLRDLKIRSASLKRLVFKDYGLNSVVEVLAPNLESLSLLGNEWGRRGFKLIAPSSVMELELHFCWARSLLVDNPQPEEHRKRREGLKRLLQNFPKLEKLNLSIISDPESNDVVQRDIVDAGKAFWRSEGKTSTFTCLQQNLKRVEMIVFVANEGGWEFIDPFVEFLLNNAFVLEKLAIRVLGKFIEAAQEVLSYKRASPSAVVLFQN